MIILTLEVPKDSQGAQMCWGQRRARPKRHPEGVVQQIRLTLASAQLCPVWDCNTFLGTLPRGGVLAPLGAASGQHCADLNSRVSPRVPFLRVG